MNIHFYRIICTCSTPNCSKCGRQISVKISAIVQGYALPQMAETFEKSEVKIISKRSKFLNSSVAQCNLLEFGDILSHSNQFTYGFLSNYLQYGGNLTKRHENFSPTFQILLTRGHQTCVAQFCAKFEAPVFEIVGVVKPDVNIFRSIDTLSTIQSPL